MERGHRQKGVPDRVSRQDDQRAVGVQAIGNKMSSEAHHRNSGGRVIKDAANRRANPARQ